ncbi:MAG: hypothetical protein DRN04_15120 [Thermoprotei archaeon]|nr:MAG: hypothetical protein DRN04_15120 [Thermoprotei archaeon]
MSGVVRLSVENWGPIKDGSVEIRPLTVFIGPNNTGKSYLAMLFYTLVRTVSRLGYRAFRFVSAEEKLESVISDIIDAYLKEKRITEDLVGELSNLISKALSEEMSKEFSSIFREELERVYSSEVGALVKLGNKEARIELTVNNPYVEFSVLSRIAAGNKLKVEKFELSLKSFLIEKYIKRKITNVLRYLSKIELHKEIRVAIKRYLESELSLWLYETSLKRMLFKGDIHYLPASRAGILHSYRCVAKALVSLASIAPVRGVEIPGIPGPLADFLGELILMGEPRRISKRTRVIKALAQLLEENVLEGEVALLRGAPEAPPTFIFKFDGSSLPITRVSSMIAEAAPLIILLKYGNVSSGDTLIIEEPEAHLHPDRQARLAVFLARLVNEAGLRFLLTTHSDVLLAKFSNLVSLSALSRDEVVRLGYDFNVALSPEKVSVYSFEPGPEGVSVVPVKVTYEGIPDDVFRRVLESLYEETMSLYYRVQESRRARGHEGSESGTD